jgi:hypothetical protein
MTRMSDVDADRNRFQFCGMSDTLFGVDTDVDR